MVDNNVLFASFLALTASLIECAEINFAVLTTKTSHFKRIINLIQIKTVKDCGIF